jgi:hypothetical protein
MDAMRQCYLEALARRLQDQPAPVRQLLQDKLQAALADDAARLAAAPPGTGAVAAPPAAATALAQLNDYIRAASPRDRQAGDELASARRFRRAWSSARSHQQVEQAAARKPANAGPLNSHALVLDALALMQELSPDYLRRFLLQVESLQWLELASAKPARTRAKRA